MFDYKGYSEEKLLEVCDEKKAFKGFSNWRYWTSEVYSFGKHIRDYGFYPKALPLMCYCDHGAGDALVYEHELNNDASCMFTFSHKKCDDYKKVSNKPCYKVIAPFVWYRRENEIEQLATAKGTIVFPVHTTPEIDLLSSVEEYIEELKKLPEDFHPICVCLHMHDINKGEHKIFLEHGFPVYTAGNAFDCRFAERFYNILKNFKYSMSDIIGSNTFYSVEMGIPFSIYGKEPLLMNNGDSNLDKGEYKYNESESYKESHTMFAGLNKEITKEQKEYVENCLGVHNSISRIQMAKVLYMAYLKKGNLIKDLLSAINHTRKYLKFLIIGGQR